MKLFDSYRENCCEANLNIPIDNLSFQSQEGSERFMNCTWWFVNQNPYYPDRSANIISKMTHEKTWHKDI